MSIITSFGQYDDVCVSQPSADVVQFHRPCLGAKWVLMEVLAFGAHGAIWKDGSKYRPEHYTAGSWQLAGQELRIAPTRVGSLTGLMACYPESRVTTRMLPEKGKPKGPAVKVEIRTALAFLILADADCTLCFFDKEARPCSLAELIEQI